jgi:DNA-binding NarL/FixJ family response regulator
MRRQDYTRNRAGDEGHKGVAPGDLQSTADPLFRSYGENEKWSVRVLLLEPDYWRYLGIFQILKTDPSISLLGEKDHHKILAMRSAPAELNPDVVIVSHSLTLDYQVTILHHLHTLFPDAQLLVEGYDEALDVIASVLRAGAKGYFQLSSEPSKLLQALGIVEKGHIWAPREALILLVNQPPKESTNSSTAADLLTPAEVSILKLLHQGFGNKDIAQSLGVAEVTIKAHLTKLYKKFGVRTRLELLAYAMTHRLIAGAGAQPPPRGSRAGS